jgi:hypothetical protein
VRVKEPARTLSLLALLLGCLFLLLATGVPSGHAAGSLVYSLPVLLAGGLIGLAVSTQDTRPESDDHKKA